VKCETAIESELKDVETYFGQYVKDPKKLATKVAEAEALHHSKFHNYVENIETAFKEGTYDIAGGAAADLLELVLGPIEQPAMQGLPPAKALPEFIEGFATEFYKVNNLTDPKCISMFEGDFQDVITAVNDLKSEDFSGAITSLTAWVATIQPDAQKCLAAVEPELKDIENYFGQYVHDKTKIATKIAEAEALHHKKVGEDIDAIKNGFSSGDYKSSGSVAADLLELVFGPVEPAVKALPPVKALPEFIEGFAIEFYKVNNLTDPKCISMFEGDFQDVITAINDLKSGDFSGAITSLTAWVATIQPDAEKCLAAVEPELKDIENYFGQYVHDKTKIAAKIAEAEALHHKKVGEDIDAIKNDFSSGDYKGSGATAADLLELVFGPVEKPAVFLQ
jgi:hypothetical protein